MKRIATSIVTMALACLGMAVDVKGATNNDRSYVAQISPSVVISTAPVPYKLSVTNDLKSGPSHFIRQVVVTVPSVFTLVNRPNTTSPVLAPPLWKVLSITGQVITFVTINSNEQSVISGKSATFTINASVGSLPAGCQSITWPLAVNQAISGGNGNAYALRAGTTDPIVHVGSGCGTPTSLTLNSVLPAGIVSSNTAASVTLMATLTKLIGGAPIQNEPITFTIGGDPVPCAGGINPTNASGVATCIYSPQSPPNTPLIAGVYDFFAHFAGDVALIPVLGASDSQAKQLAVNDGTAVIVDDASGPFGGTVDLKATLTSGNVGIGGKTITFLMNNVSVGTGVTDGSGVAIKQGVSLSGLTEGDYPNYIGVSFAGDAQYGSAANTALLTVTAVTGTIIFDAPSLTQIYTGSALSPTATTTPAGLSYTLSWNGGLHTNVGSYPVTATINPNQGYAGSINGTFVITPKPLTASITASPKTYDTTTSATITNCSLSGVVGSDDVTCVPGGATFASANVGPSIVVTGTVSLTGSAAANYTVSSPVQTMAAITQASSAVSMTGGSFVYNGSPHPATGSASTTVGSLTNPTAVTITYSGTCSSAPTTVAEGAGCTATGTYLGDANHAGNSNTASITISKAGSSVTVTPVSVPYDGNAHATTGVASTTAGSLTLPATVTIAYSGSCTVAPTTVAEGTTCTATGTYAGDDNHTGNTGTASITITKAPQTITFTAFAVAGTATSTGTVTFSVLSGNCSVTPAGAITITGPGACTVTATQAGDGNYQPVTRNTFTIGQ